MAKKKSGSAKKSARKNKATKKKAVRKTKVTLPARRSKQKNATGKKVRRATKKGRSSQPASTEIRSPERSTLGGGTFSVGERFRSGRRSASAGQAGDLQGVSRKQAVDSESVEELLEEGQIYEAEAISGVEDALEPDQGEVQTREVPEDDVPEEYTEKD